MKISWNKYNIGSLAVVLLAAGFVFSSGCSSSSSPVEPSSPPVAPAQPLKLTGYVKDAASQSAISAAAVKIGKADGTLLSTLTSGSDGSYTYDASSVTDTVLIVGATKDGYGFRAGTAKIIKASNVAVIGDILLDKLVIASAAVTPAAGGTVTAPAQTGVSTAPVTVTVPPNAVSSNVTLTAAPISISQVPPPTTANTATIAAAQFGPTGTVFSVPVTISIPLATPLTPGTIFPLQVLNETTGVYTNSGFTATVNAAGTAATAPVTHFTTYQITATVSVTLNAGTPVLGTLDYYELSAGTGTRDFSATVPTFSMAGSGISAESTMDWLFEKSGVDFSVAGSLHLVANFPTLPSNFQSGGVQVNPNASGTGNWSYRWYVQQKTTPYTGSVTVGATTVGFSASYNEWVIVAAKPTGWYWTAHNQGGVTGPF